MKTIDNVIQVRAGLLYRHQSAGREGQDLHGTHRYDLVKIHLKLLRKFHKVLFIAFAYLAIFGVRKPLLISILSLGVRPKVLTIFF